MKKSLLLSLALGMAMPLISGGEIMAAEYMDAAVITRPNQYNVASSKTAIPASVYLSWGQPVELTGQGEVTVSLGNSTGVGVLEMFGMQLEVDYSEWIWDLPSNVYVGEYTVNVPAGIVKNSAGDINPAQTLTFNIVAATEIRPTVTPRSGSELPQGGYITLNWDNQPIEIVESTPALYFEDQTEWTDTPVKFGEGVSIENGNTLKISTKSLEPGEYTLNINGAYVKIGEDTYNSAYFGYITITEAEPVYMPEAVMTRPNEYNVAASKTNIMASIYLSWGQPVELTGKGEVTVSLGNSAGTAALEMFGVQLEVDFSEWIWDLPEDVYLGEYTVDVPAGLVVNSEGELNPAQTVTFYIVKATDINPTVTPRSGSELPKGEYITLNWDNQPIEIVETTPALYFEDQTEWTETPVEFGEGVTIENGNTLKIGTSSLTPGEYTLNINGAYVKIGENDYNKAYFGYITIIAPQESGIAVASDDNGIWTVNTLDGLKVVTTTDYDKVKSLPAGLYIINGKKVIIRK